MTIAKTVEISAESKKSFEDAIEVGVARASKTIKGMESAWVKDQQVVIKDGKVKAYRVNMKVTFILK